MRRASLYLIRRVSWCCDLVVAQCISVHNYVERPVEKVHKPSEKLPAWKCRVYLQSPV